MKRFVTKLTIATALVAGTFGMIASPIANAKTNVTASKITTKNHSDHFNRKVNQYLKLLNQSAKTELINALTRDGKPTSLSDLGSKVSLHSDNQAAKSASDAQANAIFYLKLNQLFHNNINHNFQCDDGNKLATNLKEIRNDVNARKDPTKVSVVGMGLGDSLDFGNRPNAKTNNI